MDYLLLLLVLLVIAFLFILVFAIVFKKDTSIEEYSQKKSNEYSDELNEEIDKLDALSSQLEKLKSERPDLKDEIDRNFAPHWSNNIDIYEQKKAEAMRRLQILKESYNIIESTNSLETLVSRVDTIEEHLYWFMQLEKEDFPLKIDGGANNKKEELSSYYNSMVIRISDYIFANYKQKISQLKRIDAKERIAQTTIESLMDCKRNINYSVDRDKHTELSNKIENYIDYVKDHYDEDLVCIEIEPIIQEYGTCYKNSKTLVDINKYYFNGEKQYWISKFRLSEIKEEIIQDKTLSKDSNVRIDLKYLIFHCSDCWDLIMQTNLDVLKGYNCSLVNKIELEKAERNKEEMNNLHYVQDDCARTNNIGIECEKSGDIDGAIKAYEENVALNYHAMHAYKRLPALYRKKKEYQKEIDILKKLIVIYNDANESRATHLISKYPQYENDILTALETNKSMGYNEYGFSFSQFDVIKVYNRIEKVKKLLDK